MSDSVPPSARATVEVELEEIEEKVEGGGRAQSSQDTTSIAASTVSVPSHLPPPPPAHLLPHGVQVDPRKMTIEKLFDMSKQPFLFGYIKDLFEESEEIKEMVWVGRDEHGQTLIHWAALSNAVEFLKTVLTFFKELHGKVACEAFVDLASENGQTALMWACIRGHNETVHLLHTDFSASILRQDSLLATPTILAVQYHQAHTLLLLKFFGADLDQTDSVGCSSAHWASYKGDIACLRLLKYFGVDLSIADKKGMTSLHRGVSAGWVEVAHFLVDNGLDIHEKNHEGKSALDIAEEVKNRVLVHTLKKSYEKIQNSKSGSLDFNFGNEEEEDDNEKQRRKGSSLKTWIIETFSEIGSFLSMNQLSWVLPGFYVMMACLSVSVTLSDGLSIAAQNAPFLFFLTEILSPIAIIMFIVLLFSDPGKKQKRKVGDSAVEELMEILVLRASGHSAGSEEVQKKLPLGIDDPDFSNICHTCWTWRGLRSKHCSACNVCVDEFDHHCGWLNNCVAAGNHRLFVAFTVVEFMVQLVQTASLFYVLGSPEPNAGFWTHLFYACSMQPFSLLLFVLFLILTPWVGLLSLSQLRGVMANMNTNEMINSARYGHFWQPVVVRSGAGNYKSRRFHNPFDQGSLSNCLNFWFRRSHLSKYSKVEPEDVEMQEMPGHVHGEQCKHQH